VVSSSHGRIHGGIRRGGGESQEAGHAVIATEEEEWTNIGSRGETVIDYEIVNEEAWERVEEFRILERVELDHLSLKRSIEEMNYEEREKRRNKGVAEEG
jgi:hypothetical protein